MELDTNEFQPFELANFSELANFNHLNLIYVDSERIEQAKIK